MRRFQTVRLIGTNGGAGQPSLIIEGIGLVGNPQDFNILLKSPLKMGRN